MKIFGKVLLLLFFFFFFFSFSLSFPPPLLLLLLRGFFLTGPQTLRCLKTSDPQTITNSNMSDLREKIIVGCWLLVVCWWLLVGGWWLLVVGFWFVIGCWLVGCWLVVDCWLLVVGCWFVVGCLLVVGWLLVVAWLLVVGWLWYARPSDRRISYHVRPPKKIDTAWKLCLQPKKIEGTDLNRSYSGIAKNWSKTSST